MKTIILIISALFVAIVTMAYFYFSSLNSEQKNSYSSLYAATQHSPVVFSFQNDKSILDVLAGEHLFSEILGENKYKELQSLKAYLLLKPGLAQYAERQNIYISLVLKPDDSVGLLYTSQINGDYTAPQVLKAISVYQVEKSGDLVKISLPDTTILFLGTKENLMFFSNSAELVSNALKTVYHENDPFVNYIKSYSKLNKNSLAEVYVDFSKLSNQENTYAALAYNFSRQKILLTGTTLINTKNSYNELFANVKPQQISINNLLPENTSSYTIYTIDNYANWKRALNDWFATQKKANIVNGVIKHSQEKYHIDLAQIFPKYFKNQLMTFQLSTTEDLGAVNLINGDKVSQLLLELSSDYDREIRLFNEPNILYAYFGEAFKNFKRPYFTVIDNHLIFANNASTVQVFLSRYKNNRLLINNADYTHTISELPNNAGISCYVNLKNAGSLLRNNKYLPYYRTIIAEKGLKNFNAIMYQLTGENGKFQTTMLINQPLPKEDLSIDSLKIAP